MNCLHDLGGFEGLLENGVAAGQCGFILIERFKEPGGEDDADMPKLRIALHVAAEVEAGFARQKNIGQNEIGIDIGQPQQGRIAVGEADHFETFFPQDALAHTLRVWAIVSQEDAAHSELGRIRAAR